MTIPGSSIGGPRNGLPERANYAYSGTGRDELTPRRVMRRWAASVRAAGARPNAPIGSARRAQVELRLAGLRPAARPARPRQEPQQVTRREARAPAPAAVTRCDDCGYLTTAIGHKATCGGEP